MQASFNTEQNLIQIGALKRARIKNDHNQNLLNKRVDMAKCEVKDLCRFANLKSGSVADYCNALADYIKCKI